VKLRSPVLGNSISETSMISSMRILTLATALIGVAAITGPAQAGPLHCELQASPEAGGITLSAIANSSVPATGGYRLVVSKSGGAGGSAIDQSGDFALAPGAASTLGAVSMNLERGATYQARLTVTWKGGTVSCARTFPSTL
jgi:hypothetical protein